LYDSGADTRRACELHTHNLWQSHADANGDTYGNSYCNSNTNGDSRRISDCNGYGNGHSHGDCD